MKKGHGSMFLVFILSALFAAGCVSHSPEALYKTGWTYFEDITLVRDMSFDSEGNLWTAGYKGVVKLDPRTGETMRFTSENGLSRTDTISIEAASDGRIWVGMKHAGICSFDGKTWTSFESEEIMLKNILTITSCCDDSLWFASIIGDGGISRLNGREMTLYNRGNGLDAKYIIDMIETDDGTIWFASYEGGFGRFNGEKWLYDVELSDWPGGWIEAIDVTPDGTVWIGTTSNGVYSYDGENLKGYTEEDGILYNSIYDICAHPNGSVWVCTAKGVSSFDGERWTSYTEANGLLSNNVEKMEIAPDGTIVFASGSGLVCLKL